MKKFIAMLLSMMLLLTLASALAEGTTTEVWASNDSPTGYYVTFRYAGEADRVRLQGQWTFADDARGSLDVTYVQPVDWKPGYYVDGSFEVYELVKNEDGVFEYTLPLPHGTFSYWFYLNGDAKNTADITGATQVFDPALPPMLSEGLDLATLSAGSNRSHIYIPLDESKCYGDLSAQAPRTDGIGGAILYEAIDVTVADGSVVNVPFGIYLPYGFDANREEAYKVMVLSHGGGGDHFNWPNNGCAKNILDNYYGLMEDTVFVFPNNTVFQWNYDNIHTSIVGTILPYMVENYNVSEAVEDRAFGGLSMGGMTTTYMLLNHPTDFAEFYIMSGSRASSWASDDLDWEAIRNVKVGVLGGWQAGDYNDNLQTRQLLDKYDVDYEWYNCNGGHTWEVWRNALTNVVAEHLWK